MEGTSEMKKYCSVCGAELDENDVFCGACGAVQRERHSSNCRYCGAALEPGGEYCPNCGRRTVIDSADRRIYAGNKLGGNGGSGDYRRGVPNGMQDSLSGAAGGGNVSPYKGGNTGTIIAAVCSAIAVIAVVVCLVIVFGPGNSERADREAGTALVTENITPTPWPTATPSQSMDRQPGQYNDTARVPVQSYAPAPPPARPTVPPSADTRPDNSYSKSYLTYRDSEYSFSCPYPSDFILTHVDNNFFRYTLAAPDGSGAVYICATQNSNGRTPQTVRDNFLATYGGTPDYENSGSSWCAISTFDGSQWHYGYFSLSKSMIRGFEVHYSDAYRDRYDKYINDIYDGLSLN